MHMQSRRRQIGAKGRQMLLRRLVAAGAPTVDVALTGVLRPFTPERITGGVEQGDAHVATLNDEIAAAAWPAPPRAGDQMVIDGKTWSVVGAESLYEGTLLLGYRVWVRGGA